MGGKSFKSKKKKPGGGRGKIKFPQKKKNRDQGKIKNWEGGGEKIKLQKEKLRSGLRKCKQKKVNLGWHRDRKENPISAPFIHVGALVGAASLWPNVGIYSVLKTWYIPVSMPVSLSSRFWF